MNNLVTQISDELFDILLKKREEEPNFKFALRQRNQNNNQPRLQNGYWFQGNDFYIFVPLWNKGDNKNKTKTIGFVLNLDHNDRVTGNYLELAYPDEIRPLHLEFYDKIKDYLTNQQDIKLKRYQKGNKKTFDHFEDPHNWENNFQFYLNNFQPFVQQLIIQYGFENEFVFSDNQFLKNLDRINRLRPNIQNSLVTINYPASFPDHGQFQKNYRETLNIDEDVRTVTVRYRRQLYTGLTLGVYGRGTGRIYFTTQKQQFIDNNPHLKGSESITIRVIPEGINELELVDESILFEYSISALTFETIFPQFKEYILHLSGELFEGFDKGYIHDNESYKLELREKALNALQLEKWDESMIGSGEILTNTIAAIEVDGNNLVDISGRYGPNGLDHRRLIAIKETGDGLAQLENTFYEFFNNQIEEEDAFDELKEQIGGIYALLAYIFFLKDENQFAPISTSNFETSFQLLDCDIKLQASASWKNYSEYNQLIHQTKQLLVNELDTPIRTIDAHSFLWIIGNQGLFKDWMNEHDEESETIIVFETISTQNEVKSEKKRNFDSLPPEQNKDWATLERRKRKNGRKAELIVLDYERKRLEEAGRSDLAEKVQDYSKRLGCGYDILSWNETDNSQRCIEVKSVKNNQFYITANELARCEHGKGFCIYLVRKENNQIRIQHIPSPQLSSEEHFSLTAQNYLVTFSNKNSDS